jgi:hypothetical protein
MLAGGICLRKEIGVWVRYVRDCWYMSAFSGVMCEITDIGANSCDLCAPFREFVRRHFFMCDRTHI